MPPRSAARNPVETAPRWLDRPEPPLIVPEYVGTLTVERAKPLFIAWMAEAQEAVAPPPEYMTRQRLAIALDVSTQLVDKITREGCPHVIVGDSKRYRLADVHAWLAARSAGEVTP